jgi:hypothetical protein
MKSTLKDVTFKTTAKQMGINLNEGTLNKAEAPEYHYGLRICLSEDMIKMMGFKDELPEVGSTMKMKALVEVCCTSENESKEYGLSRSMDLQITEMELDQGKKTDHEKVLYGKNVVETE